MKKFITIAAVVALTGCASKTPLTPEQIKQLEAPVCTSQAECSLMWQRSQVWLANNSAWKIQVANDVVLQTYGSMNSSPDLSYAITKEPIGGGGYQIRMRAGCANMFACLPKSATERIIEFNNYLKQGL